MFKKKRVGGLSAADIPPCFPQLQTLLKEIICYPHTVSLYFCSFIVFDVLTLIVHANKMISDLRMCVSCSATKHCLL